MPLLASSWRRKLRCVEHRHQGAWPLGKRPLAEVVQGCQPGTAGSGQDIATDSETRRVHLGPPRADFSRPRPRIVRHEPVQQHVRQVKLTAKGATGDHDTTWNKVVHMSKSEIEIALHRQLQAAFKTCIHKNGKIFLELFSGIGSVASALRNRGYAAVAFDIHESPMYDLCNRYVLPVVKDWICNGLAAGIWFGTPCTTWSQACRPAVRDRLHIWGMRLCRLAVCIP